MRLLTYRQVSNIRRTLVSNEIVDHSDVVGASPVAAAPTTSSSSTLTPGFNELGKDNCRLRRETFEFCNSVRLILETWRYCQLGLSGKKCWNVNQNKKEIFKIFEHARKIRAILSRPWSVNRAWFWIMLTSGHTKLFRIPGLKWTESTWHRASDTELWCCLRS